MLIDRHLGPSALPIYPQKAGILAGAALTLLLATLPPCVQAQDSPATQPAQTGSASAAPVLPRGKKLALKNGGILLVREYSVEGDRIKYYDLDSSQWEQMPANLVDWDATKKLQAEEAQQDAAMLAKVHKQEAARMADPIDIDASLEAAPGVFLPPGEGIFAFDGHAILPLSQTGINSRLSKGHFLEQVLVPVPIVPTRHDISIAGEHAKLRLPAGELEFYMRTADGRNPEMRLIRAKVHGGKRDIEHVDELFKEQAESADTISMQTWEAAKGVHRFTLSQPLAPGEYVLAEVVREQGLSFYVWDFGVDSSSSATTK
jgi:hypothetical protein